MCVFGTLSSKDLIVMTLYNVNNVDNIYIDNLNIIKVEDFIDSLIYSLKIKGTTNKRTNNKKLKMHYNNFIEKILDYESVSYEENNKYVSNYIKYCKIVTEEFIKFKKEYQIYENSSKCITDNEYLCT